MGRATARVCNTSSVGGIGGLHAVLAHYILRQSEHLLLPVNIAQGSTTCWCRRLRGGGIGRHRRVSAKPRRWLLGYRVYTDAWIQAVRRGIKILRRRCRRRTPWIGEMWRVGIRRHVVEVKSAKLTLLVVYGHSHHRQ